MGITFLSYGATHLNICYPLMYKIFLEASRDNVKSFDDAINLSTGTGKSIDPQIAVSTKDNSVLVVWTDSEPGKAQNFVRASTDNADYIWESRT